MSGSQSELYKHVEIIDYVGDMVGADKPADQLKVSIVDQETSPEVDVVDRAGRTLGTVSVDQLPEPVTTDLADALASNANDTVRVASPSPLDVSASTVPVEQQTPVEIGTWSGGTLPVDQQGVLDVSSRDSRNLGDVDVTALTDAAPISDSTSATGSGSAAMLDLGALRKDVDLYYDTSGAAKITIEVRQDGGTWRQFQTISPSAAETDVAQIDTAYEQVRAYIDANVNTLELVSKGA